MLRFVADENFDNRIVRGLRRVVPSIDLVRVQDVGLLHADDAVVLEWAASEGRILLTHDETTIPAQVYENLMAGARVPGVVIIKRLMLSIGETIADLRLLAECGGPEEFEDPIRFPPF